MPGRKRKNRRRKSKNAQKNTAANTKGPGTADTLSKDHHMPLSALSALGETLPAPKPLVQPPRINTAAIVEEGSLKASTAVRVGEREDSLPPKYRTPKETVAPPPAPAEMKPSMDAGEALDILSGDFKSPEGHPAHQTSGSSPKASNKQQSMDSAEALDILSGDFKSSVNPPHHQASVPTANNDLSSIDAALDDLGKDLLPKTSTQVLKCGGEVPTQANQQFSTETVNALEALSNTLMDSSFDAEPAPVPGEVIVETVITEKHVHKLGERDDTLPPNYRFPKTSLDGEANHEKEVTLKKEQTGSGESGGQNGSHEFPVTT